jgi:hypothetical protein
MRPSLELADSRQRGAPQRQGIAGNRALTVALDPRQPAIERRNQLSQVVEEGLV